MCIALFIQKKKKMQKEKLLWKDRLSKALEKGIPRWIFRSGRLVFRPIRSFLVQGAVQHL